MISESAASSPSRTTLLADAPQRERQHVTVAALLAAVTTLVFTALYWNRFLAASVSGTFLVIAQDMLQGRIPYRDFFLVVPPLHPLKLAGLIAIFGDNLAVIRFAGMLERGILAGITAVWLARFVRVPTAFLVTAAAMIVFAGDHGDALNSYHHDSVLWGVCSGFCASLCFNTRKRGTFLCAAAGAGIFAGCCFLTKQTTGAGVFLAVGLLTPAILWRTQSGGSALRFLITFSLACALPVGAIGFWLYRNDALAAAIDCIFRNATSKGSGVSLIFRPLVQSRVVVALAIVLVLSSFALSRSRWIPRVAKHDSVTQTLTRFAAVIMFIAIGWWVVAAGIAPPASRFVDLCRGLLIQTGLIGCGFVFLSMGYRVLRKLPETLEIHLLFIAGVSFAMAYMLGLSFAYYEPMAVPALAVVLALALDRLPRGAAAEWTAVAAAGVIILFYTHLKFQTPFGWMTPWREAPVAQATQRSELPLLKGLRLPHDTISRTERIVRAIHAHAKPGDTILTYPYLPLFYALSGFRPPTYAYLHYIDVTPDVIADKDRVTLLRERPAVIVYQRDAEGEMRHVERLYRGGRPSGSRRFAEAIEMLAKEYELVDTIEGPGIAIPVQIFAAHR